MVASTLPVREFSTTLGPVPIWGEIDADKPQLLLIRGAFAEAGQWESLARCYPDCAIALAHLPGINTPMLAETGIRAFRAAFQEIIDREFGPQVNVAGFSMGGLVALALRRVRSILAVDPPLRTAGLWPMRDWLEHKAATEPAYASWIWQVFGAGPGRIEERDYRWVLDGLDVPAAVMLAAEPLEPERACSSMPSLVSDADRLVYAAAPVRTVQVQGVGHNIPADAIIAVLHYLSRALGHAAVPAARSAA